MPKKPSGRLVSARIEQDRPASAQATDRHRGYCRGMLNGILTHVDELLIEKGGNTRIHKEDARQFMALVDEFRTEAFNLFRTARIQDNGVRAASIDDCAGADLSNVVMLGDRGLRP
jgi:hypothetical protein